MICELTGLPISNASLLDESLAAGESLFMAYQNNESVVNPTFVIDSNLFEQTKSVLKTKAKYLNVNIVETDVHTFDFNNKSEIIGVLV